MSREKGALSPSGHAYMSVKILYSGMFLMSGIFVFVLSFPLSAQASWFGLFDFLSRTDTNAQSVAASASLPLLESQQSPGSTDDANSDQTPDDSILLQVADDAALVAPRNPIGVYADTTHDQIVVYKVKSGDSPAGIAKRFGITLNTLLWANDLRTASSIKVGDDLVILPVSGVKYQVKRGDTIEFIAKKFKSKEDDLSSVVTDILQFNGLAVNEKLEEGSIIIIPDGEMIIAAPVPTSKTPALSRPNLGLPEYIGYFLRPVIGGYNPRVRQANYGIHGYNGVDLAVDYGTQIAASAEGTVIRAKSTGWNGGYGKYVVISHPNGTQTLYAHMSSVIAAVGQRVVQGGLIGYVGSTGNSTGPHVHFEIRGAKNPFWK